MPERERADSPAGAGPGRPDRTLGLLGMATRAGTVVPGTERVREAARAGTLRLAVVASDASENSRGKLLPLLIARGISHVIRYGRDELGAAIGRGPVSAAGVLDDALAARLLVLLAERADDVPAADPAGAVGDAVQGDVSRDDAGREGGSELDSGAQGIG